MGSSTNKNKSVVRVRYDILQHSLRERRPMPSTHLLLSGPAPDEPPGLAAAAAAAGPTAGRRGRGREEPPVVPVHVALHVTQEAAEGHRLEHDAPLGGVRHRERLDLAAAHHLLHPRHQLLRAGDGGAALLQRRLHLLRQLLDGPEQRPRLALCQHHPFHGHNARCLSQRTCVEGLDILLEGAEGLGGCSRSPGRRRRTSRRRRVAVAVHVPRAGAAAAAEAALTLATPSLAAMLSALSSFFAFLVLLPLVSSLHGASGRSR
mmetsp:Transcript_6778/g.17368  ORF Transcript_6778/g.17368 Transcript_6778/m.17368 type:complete len:262 (-) Transcript_6778:432-1217(-)